MADESLQNAPIKDERKTHIPVVLKVAEIVSHICFVHYKTKIKVKEESNLYFMDSNFIFFQFLSIFAVGLIVDPFNSFMRVFNKPRTKVDDIAFIYITIGGYMLINSILIITHLLGDRVPKRTVNIFPANTN